MEPPVTIITLGTRRYRKITPESAVAGSRRRPAVRRVDPEEEEEHEDGGCCPPEAVGEDEVAQNDQEQDKEKESDAPAESKQETIQHQYNVRKQGQDFVLAESIPEEFYGRIIGKGGSNLRDVQAATGCRLFIPRNAGQTFQIRGPTEGAVVNAMNMVKKTIEAASARATEKQDYTHFISVPLNMPEVKEKVASFMQKAMDTGAKGLDESIFVSPETMHLTLFMMRLTPDQEQEAVAKMQSLAPQIYDAVGSTCVTVRLQGLDIMNRDPSAAHVMYLKTVDGEGMSKLRKVTDMLARALLSEQDIKEQQIFDRSGQIAVKYHATLINTKHRANGQAANHKGNGNNNNNNNNNNNSNNGRFVRREPFDARPIFDALGNIDVGVVRFPAIHLSERHSRDDDGYYHCVHKQLLP